MIDEYSTGGHNTPTPDSHNDIVPIGYDTDQKTYVTVKYSRKLNTGDTAGKDAVFTFGQTGSWSYAWKTGSLSMVYHGSDYTTFTVKLDNVSASKGNGSTGNMTSL